MSNAVLWEQRGRLSFCEKVLPKFPCVESVAGLYRLSLDNGWIYIGEAKDLQHRLSEYRRPTTGVISEHRIHQALKEAGGAIVEVFISGNLSEKTSRCSLEADAIRAARLNGQKVLNGSHVGEAYCLRLDIAYHETQIGKLRRKLAQLPPETV